MYLAYKNRSGLQQTLYMMCHHHARCCSLTIVVLDSEPFDMFEIWFVTLSTDKHYVVIMYVILLLLTHLIWS